MINFLINYNNQHHEHQDKDETKSIPKMLRSKI